LSDEDTFLNALREWMEASMHRSFHAFIRHNRESDLSLSQVNSLFHLYHHGASSVNDLANHLGITTAAVSQLLDPLIDADLVLRSENPEDRRMKLIALTEKGKAKVKRSMNTRHAWLSDLSKLLSETEKEDLLPAINLLNKRTRELNLEGDWPCEHHSKG
jgi:DNA-binding MarR family transcriptional regulator